MNNTHTVCYPGCRSDVILQQHPPPVNAASSYSGQYPRHKIHQFAMHSGLFCDMCTGGSRYCSSNSVNAWAMPASFSVDNSVCPLNVWINKRTWWQRYTITPRPLLAAAAAQVHASVSLTLMCSTSDRGTVHYSAPASCGCGCCCCCKCLTAGYLKPPISPATHPSLPPPSSPTGARFLLTALELITQRCQKHHF